MKYNIREIEEKDNKEVENVIRACLIEFGANHEGTAWADPNLGRFSEIYNTDGNKYLVAIDENGKIVGGVGIGKLDGIEDVCELQKMYCLPETRGTGISHKLMDMALEYAKKYFGNNIRSFALLENENIIGAVSISIYKGKSFIEALAVDKKYRNRGYGKSLIEKAIGELEKPVYIISKVDEFYLKNGFVYSNEELIDKECKACNEYNITCFPKVVVYR